MQPIGTFSIVARDPSTGELGIAVQSKFLAVGMVVPWAKASAGAIATKLVTFIHNPQRGWGATGWKASLSS
jgi:uncharacterized Ntn-hydrolase superfamily protein